MCSYQLSFIGNNYPVPLELKLTQNINESPPLSTEGTVLFVMESLKFCEPKCSLTFYVYYLPFNTRQTHCIVKLPKFLDDKL